MTTNNVPSDPEFLSLAYDVNAMPEQMTDAGLYRFARALLDKYGQGGEVADSLMDSEYLRGVGAGWNAAQADDPNAAKQAIYDSRNGYLKPLRDAQKARRRITGEKE